MRSGELKSISTFFAQAILSLQYSKVVNYASDKSDGEHSDDESNSSDEEEKPITKINIRKTENERETQGFLRSEKIRV